MIVRILKTPRTKWGGAPWVPPGEIMDVWNDRLARELIERGEAEEVVPQAPEAAVAAPAERAVKPRARKRKA